ncbi:cadmium, cobalt and zinc/H(+)-K(+) antiporter [Lysinibacillus alkalisoli]|uniref:Cadmium, cobalt and zinc/H(+)-K(+) antiporter n=1 Tax=Lysinibacillus alkalisoli TaxID=1911548 RepID=A0A917G845_9BACI|nr:cation diffusion facilitator family transporter [Lysinibacillus alkalisoli]GGG27793.1 cadmium, cobalt and zinc/H(+)-K(+) antiporter [Lysinibacillus alkalisoli]
MTNQTNQQSTHDANKKVLIISFIIITTYMIIEVIGGVWTNSLALLSDAGHMLSDAISLAIALIAFKLGEKATSKSKTYGYKRFEILAALLNGATLFAIAIFIYYEAIHRFTNPPEVATTGMLIISTIGLLVNIFVAWYMFRGADTKDNLNMRGAFLHVIGDMLGSVGAIIAALLMMFFGWGWADPLASVLVATLVLRSGFMVMKSSVHVLMEGTPASISVERMVEVIKNVEGVKNLHDVHVWAITSGLNALSAHVVVNGQLTVIEAERIIKKIEHDLEHENIQHVTLQIESEQHPHDDEILCTIKGPMPDAHAGHNH